MQSYDNYTEGIRNSSFSIVLETEYFFIIKEDNPNRKTPIYHINENNTRDEIGEIKWYSAWRKYCFFPEYKTVWDNKCILQVMNFMNEINLAKYKDKEG